VSTHRYFLCLEDGAPPIPWDLQGAAALDRFDAVYFGRALQAMERRLRTVGLTFYLTWSLQELPRYGDDVVALMLGDEDARMPAYADSVLAVFKTYGSRPVLGSRPLHRRDRLSLLLLLQHVRRLARHLPDDVRGARRRLRGRPSPAVETIPLGYYNQLDLPLIPFESRSTDVFFAGSLELRPRSRLSPRHWLRMPKPVARQRMLDAVHRLQRRRPDMRIELRLPETFLATTRSDAEAYSRRLIDSRICLVPRGASVETYRYFEALRYGCVVICEPLPPTWFYDGSPAITVEDWAELPDLVERLLADPAGLAERHAQSLAWWEERCSERALGAFMAQRIDALTGR
jgi:hypothetical protein